MVEFEHLPSDVLHYLFNWCSLSSILVLLYTSKKLNILINNRTILDKETMFKKATSHEMKKEVKRACFFNRLGKFKMLLKNENLAINLNYVLSHSLKFSIMKGHFSIINYLSEKDQLPKLITCDVGLKTWCITKKFRFIKKNYYLDNNSRCEPVIAACYFGQVQLFNYLSDLKGSNLVKHYCLFVAIKQGHLDIIKLLLPLNNEEEIDFMTKFKDSPFFLAVSTGNLDVVAYFLQTYRNIVNKGSYCDISPLYQACCMGNFALVELLITWGATISNWEIKIAKRNNHSDVVSFLNEKQSMSERGCRMMRRNRRNLHYEGVKKKVILIKKDKILCEVVCT
jgi:hypothetical protein